MTKSGFGSHLVSVRVGAHGVLCGQSNAAGHDHEQDGHLKVAQGDHVVTDLPDTMGSIQGRDCNC